MPEPLETFAKVFRSPARRALACFFLLCIVLSVISDSNGTGTLKNVSAFFSAVGVGGGFLFFGVNLFRFVPDNAPNRWQFIGLAIFSIIAGVLSLVVGLASIWLY